MSAETKAWVHRFYETLNGALATGDMSGLDAVIATEAVDHNPDPDESTIRQAISGQICRCTGYENIVRAVRAAAGHPSQPSGRAAADPATNGDSTVVAEPSQEVPA